MWRTGMIILMFFKAMTSLSADFVYWKKKSENHVVYFMDFPMVSNLKNTSW